MINIKINSKDVKLGDVFVAIKGEKNDGHDFIEEAIKNGASKIVCEHGNYSVNTLVVKDTKEYLKEYLVNNYSDQFNDLKFIGVTGTNGKTTTCFLVSQILTNLNLNNAYIGTIGYYINGEKIKDLNNTTPDILTLYNLILNAKSTGAKYIVMEVSSHSLDMERIRGIKFDVGGYTNLTRDHLDYHKTMENYLNSKKKIINYLKEDGVLIVNSDDRYSFHFLEGKYMKVGSSEEADYKIITSKEMDEGTKIVFSKEDRNYLTYTNLSLEFNVYNYMMALAIVNNLDISIMDILRVTKNLVVPAGRNEVISFNNRKVVIDYAHTPDAVMKILTNTRNSFDGKIITVIGCGGNRDKTKRPLMGAISTKVSDYVIFTNDNPRREDPETIMNQILVGAEENYEVIFDRKEAILRGLSLLLEGDILMILGKGHEDYQIIYDTKTHFSDKEVALDYINENKLKLHK